LPSSSDTGKDEKKGYSVHMRGVAWSLLVMSLSLVAIIAAWATIGVRGPNFSVEVMEQQQKQLREQYGLPPAPELGPEELEIPPSLRNASQDNFTRLR
jgi:hypothetical protein